MVFNFYGKGTREMIDLRWLETKDGKVLQYRERPDTTYCWTEWETIPTVKAQEK